MLLVESGLLREVHLTARKEDAKKVACSTQAPKTKADIFWDWFRANETRLYDYERRENNGVIEELRSELLKVDPNLTLEIQPKGNGASKRGVVVDDKVTPYDSKAIMDLVFVSGARKL